MSIEIKIDCDGLGCCEEFTDGSDPAYIVEMAVEGADWYEKFGFHYCPECAKTVKDEE